jgi:Fe-S-cluster containining protein
MALTPASVLLTASTANHNARLQAAKSVKNMPAIECRAGCAWCCYMPVDVYAPEALYIADRLRQTLAKDQYATVLKRVRETAAQITGTTKTEQTRLRLACPLLDVDKRCSIYSHRPISCAGFVSFSAAACENAFVYDDEGDRERIPMSPEVLGYTRKIEADSVEELIAAGAPRPEPLEFTIALRIAMEDPDAAGKWLRGEPVFAEARRRNE